MDTKILDLFRKHRNEYLSGEEISRKLKVSRAAVWKHIEKLREIGYDIEAMPHLGYKLKSVPDKMIPDEIKYGLNTRIFGKKIYSFELTDSTNKIAYDLAEKGADEGAVVLAEQQKKGKGRLGRIWISPPGGIYMSCIIRPDIRPNEIQEFTLVTALSVADSIMSLTGLEARIKWPNDILINRKKVCGILTEMKAESDRIDFIILGIGINANTNEKILPQRATSLKAELKGRISRVELVRSILFNLEKEYGIFKEKGFKGVRDEIKNLSATLGKRVKVTSYNKIYEGEAMDIDEEGALILRLDTGLMQRILSGDVTLVRGA
ncbi:MAG: biotin--[acetyl-CoA-carboxylase] ligase [Candidatus Omnitrophica bacterium]|nr:biotin--[acetyl-CoA-carboxylase] ligase [Candidatus Omnitrophota bacterium]